MRAKESQKRSCKRREKEEKYRENEEKDGKRPDDILLRFAY